MAEHTEPLPRLEQAIFKQLEILNQLQAEVSRVSENQLHLDQRLVRIEQKLTNMEDTLLDKIRDLDEKLDIYIREHLGLKRRLSDLERNRPVH